MAELEAGMKKIQNMIDTSREKHITVEMKCECGEVMEKKRINLKGLRGIHPKRTGKPRWATPEEIKGIWEVAQKTADAN